MLMKGDREEEMKRGRERVPTVRVSVRVHRVSSVCVCVCVLNGVSSSYTDTVDYV